MLNHLLFAVVDGGSGYSDLESELPEVIFEGGGGFGAIGVCQVRYARLRCALPAFLAESLVDVVTARILADESLPRLACSPLSLGLPDQGRPRGRDISDLSWPFLLLYAHCDHPRRYRNR